ncbi:MAG: GNAT family N-acetyltransferase [Alphaproteobacteria bacterium]|nr:GNAT family N-acetyltransferase [Alphaproteobacteria bacterium]
MGVDAVEIRPFEPDEWKHYKAIRLRALQSDPHCFSSTYKKEAAYPDEKWQEDFGRAGRVVFAVLHYGDVIGLTAVSLLREDETGRTAKLWGSWLEPEWRGKGVSEKMYEARLNWARAQEGVRRVVVSHRESNVASKKANQKHGFTFTHAEGFFWPDGKEEPEVFYELWLEEPGAPGE